MPTEIALLPFILVPLLAGAFLFLRSFGSRSRFHVSNFWILVSFCSVAAAICLTSNLSWQERYPDTQIGAFAFLGQFALLPLDWIGFSWCIMTAGLTWLILSWPSSSVRVTPLLREHFAGLWLCSLSAMTAFANDVWLQWGGTVACGWLLCLLLARDEEESEAAKGAGVCLIWLTVADFVWMFGLLTFQLVWVTPQVGFLTNWEYLRGLSDEQISLAVTAQMLMLVSLVLRCGLYPLMTWTRSAAFSDRSAAWVIVFGLGQGMLLLFRWAPMLSAFHETRLLMAGFGALSALLLGILAVVGCTGPRRLVTMTSIWMAIIWIGQVTDLATTGIPIASFGFFLLAFATCLTLGCEGIVWSPERKFHRTVVLFLGGVLCSGLLGQELVFDQLSRIQNMPGLSPWTLVAAAIVGQTLAATAIFREVNARCLRDLDHEMSHSPDDEIPRLGWFGLAIFAPLSALAVAMLPRLLGGSVPDLPALPIMSLVTAGIAFVAARTWPDSARKIRADQQEEAGVLRRLAENDYYAPRIVKLFTRAPARIVSQLVRFMDWFLLTQLVQKFPEQMMHRVSDAAAFADEETTEKDATWQVVGALACLLIGLGLAGMM